MAISRNTRNLLLLSLFAVLAGALMGCAVLDALGIGTAVPAPTLVATMTPAPAPTPTPTLDAPVIRDLADLPDEPGAPFALVISEDEVNEELADLQYEREGLVISEPHITLADGEMVGRFSVRYDQMNVSFGIIARGEPRLVEGDLYFRIENISLEEGLSGITRRIVEGLLNEGIDQLSTENGVRVDLDRLESTEIALDDVRVEPGQLVVLAHRR